jgi:hypothetical protein
VVTIANWGAGTVVPRYHAPEQQAIVPVAAIEHAELPGAN